jgi:hypothetical protein
MPGSYTSHPRPVSASPFIWRSIDLGKERLIQMPSFDLIEKQINAGILDIAFTTKPLIVGGLAMEYYGLRKHGSDIDFIVSFDDYAAAAQKYPNHKKDSWGDLGISVHGFEMFRTIWRLDYAFCSAGSIEYDNYRVIGTERLLMMKVLAMNAAEKHKADVDLILKYILNENQRPDIVEYMNSHIASYLASPDGFVYNEAY